MNNALKQFIPPILKRIVKFRFKEGWHGNFKNWEDAQKVTTGYDARTIIDRVRQSALKAKRGEVAYEQSARTYDQPSVNVPVLASLLYAAQRDSNKLIVLDFGGSLGSLYYQMKPHLAKFSQLTWCIVEQSSFVDVGKEEFEDEELHFYYSVEECLEVYQPSIILFSSSLQYLKDPYKTIEELFKFKIPYFVLDRTAFIEGEKDRLTIQKVPPAYYDASYPCWFLSRSKFLQFMSPHYNLLQGFPDEIYLQLGLQHLRYEGMWFERKHPASSNQ